MGGANVYNFLANNAANRFDLFGLAPGMGGHWVVRLVPVLIGWDILEICIMGVLIRIPWPIIQMVIVREWVNGPEPEGFPIKPRRRHWELHRDDWEYQTWADVFPDSISSDSFPVDSSMGVPDPWGVSLANSIDGMTNAAQDYLATGSTLANLPPALAGEFIRGAADVFRFGEAIGNAAYNTQGDWLDKASAAAPDMVRGGKIVGTIAGAGGAAGRLRHGGGKKEVDALARQFGIKDGPTRGKLGQYIEDAKSDMGRGGADNLKWNQLEDLAREFLGR